ncbi:sigma-70 family RNA polymerase sigma factor [Streptomyces sp. NPDC094049]|uniref:RNA polymerase sigma factor n=1 Tax=Streptomyces sp. NPDC094049 TaxID=3154987 RepID=UPI003319BB33
MSDVGTEEPGATGPPRPPLPTDGRPAGYWEFHARLYDRFVRFARYDLRSDELAEAAVDTTFAELMYRWPKVAARENPTAHAWTVLKRRLVDQGRRRHRTALPVDDPILWGLLDERAGAHDAFDALALRISVRNAVHRLPERQRDVITLYFLLDQPTSVVAEVLGINEATVRSHISRALPRLGRTLDLPGSRPEHRRACS